MKGCRRQPTRPQHNPGVLSPHGSALAPPRGLKWIRRPRSSSRLTTALGRSTTRSWPGSTRCVSAHAPAVAPVASGVCFRGSELALLRRSCRGQRGADDSGRADEGGCAAQFGAAEGACEGPCPAGRAVIIGPHSELCRRGSFLRGSSIRRRSKRRSSRSVREDRKRPLTAALERAAAADRLGVLGRRGARWGGWSPSCAGALMDRPTWICRASCVVLLKRGVLCSVREVRSGQAMSWNMSIVSFIMTLLCAPAVLRALLCRTPYIARAPGPGPLVSSACAGGAGRHCRGEPLTVLVLRKWADAGGRDGDDGTRKLNTHAGTSGAVVLAAKRRLRTTARCVSLVHHKGLDSHCLGRVPQLRRHLMAAAVQLPDQPAAARNPSTVSTPCAPALGEHRSGSMGHAVAMTREGPRRGPLGGGCPLWRWAELTWLRTLHKGLRPGIGRSSARGSRPPSAGPRPAARPQPRALWPAERKRREVRRRQRVITGEGCLSPCLGTASRVFESTAAAAAADLWP